MCQVVLVGQDVGGLVVVAGQDDFLQGDQVGVQVGEAVAQDLPAPGQSPRMPQVFSVATRTDVACGDEIM
jgi:hypothetical protein